MKPSPYLFTAAIAVATAVPATAVADAVFVNGIALPGALSDASGGTSANNGRVGYFSDIYYDRQRNEWWGLSDRGPGGGSIDYDTRMQRFSIDVNSSTGAISNFQIRQTIVFKDGGAAFNGLAPNPAGTLGRSFDPEGVVVLPKTGNFLVSDEYGPSLKEFDRSGNLVRSYGIPANLTPKVGASVDYNATAATLTAGRENNRGLEGLAVSPDGRYAYAILQNGTIQDGYNKATGVRGQYTRIIKFDTDTGQAVAQYAYKLDSSGQGRGVSALVALGADRFLVLERNNRGIGVAAQLAPADKNVYQIDLSLASDVSGINLPASGALPVGVNAVYKNPTKVADLDANTLAALGNKSPEKWEGLAIGPRLDDGNYLMLAGTDNDYSVTQNGTGVQFDVYYRFSDVDPYASSIQCPLDSVVNCFFTSNSAFATLTSDYALLPGVLHAYKVSDDTLGGYVAPVPEPGSLSLALLALAGLGTAARRRRG